MLFVDEYIPKNMNDSLFHKDEIEILKKMSKDESIPHLIFYGPEGCGKKVLIKLFLEKVYDKQVNKLTESIYKVTGSGNISTDVTIRQSNYHIIIEPNNTNFDRYLIQDVVKEYAKKIPLGIFSSKKKFKTVLINNIDNLSYYAQTSLRRTMEKYSKTCRFIMWCKSLSKVIDPLKSRCYSFRIRSPPKLKMMEFILKINYEKKIYLSCSDFFEILNKGNGNIKKTLWLLQLKRIGETFKTSYESAIKLIVNHILSKNIDEIITIRKIFYDITTTNINGTQILKDILFNILDEKSITFEQKIKIIEISALIEHNLVRHRRDIMHLEYYINSLIYILYKNVN